MFEPPELRARLKLLRIPLAGTTVADVWAGWFCAGLPVEPATLALTHGAALSFYFAGMTLNDVFDRERDRALHPERPIPSGAIPARAAAVQGALLLAAGLGLGAAAGRAGAGALLAAAILAYDGLLKRWAVPGAIAMGACRYLDVQLGAGFARGALFAPALALGVYVTALTLVSTLEDDPDRDRALIRTVVRRLLLGIFFVDATSLLLAGHTGLAAAAAALAASFPLLARLMGSSR